MPDSIALLFNNVIPMPDGINIHNASHERCDMAVGPCCCGAWHHYEDWAPEIRSKIKKSEAAKCRKVKGIQQILIISN